MSDTRGIPGSRRANNSGGIAMRRLSTGELRYHVRYRGEHRGAFASRAEAEAALEVALLEYMLREIRTNCGHGFGALLPAERVYAEQLAEAYLLNADALTAPEVHTLADYVVRVKKANEVV